MARRASATCSLILDWYFPDSLIDTSNNRISLNILFDDDRSNSHAVYTAKTSWKGGDCQNNGVISNSASYGVTDYGEESMGLTISIEMPSMFDSAYILFASFHSFGTLGIFANDGSIVLDSDMNSENLGGIFVLLTDKYTMGEGNDWREGSWLVNSTWTAQQENIFEPEVTFNSLSSYQVTSFGENQIQLIADISAPHLLKDSTEIALDVSSKGSLITFTELSKITFTDNFQETNGGLGLNVEVQNHNSRFHVETAWARPGVLLSFVDV